ncbi:KGG domain-containing protein [Deinococcus ficus]|uniref:KGG domain-containing protein n=1 Tax=Deinococcus ficus TaxID=317577 RepID=UPI0003B5710D|nr:KGG domain-containing protein [Deinococcus ficus]
MTNSDRSHASNKGDSRTQAGTRRRGFAGMDPERQRQIASMGGRAAHESGNAHEFTTEEARAAGRKGGEAVSRNREHMAAIGRRGGEASRSGENGSRREGPAKPQAAAGGQNRGTD